MKGRKERSEPGAAEPTGPAGVRVYKGGQKLANGFRGLMLILRVTLAVAKSQSNGQKELCGIRKKPERNGTGLNALTFLFLFNNFASRLILSHASVKKDILTSRRTDGRTDSQIKMY